MKVFLRTLLMPFTGVLLFTIILGAKANAQQTPTLATDQTIYASGATVSISGNNFAPNEIVTLQVSAPNASQDNDPAYQDWTVQADTSGNIASTWTIPSDQEIQGTTLVLKAHGQSSSLQTEQSFTIKTEPPPRNIAVTSDKADYAPGATVFISGKDFAPNEIVTLQVLPPDSGDIDPAYQQWNVRADASGNVASTWALPAGQEMEGVILVLTAYEPLTDSRTQSTFTVKTDTQTGNNAKITSDLADYAPRSTAVFKGSGFAPNENVVLKVKNLNRPCNTVSADSSYLPWTVQAGPDGSFVTQWTVCDCDGDSLRLKATGQVSGSIAYAYFTDYGTVSVNGSGAPSSLSIIADRAANATSPLFTSVGNIVMDENTIILFDPGNNDFHTNLSQITLTAPSGWEFNTSGVGVTATTNRDISAITIASVSTNTITINLTVAGTSNDDQIIISGVQIRSTNGAVLPNSGAITLSFNGTIDFLNSPVTIANLTQTVGTAKKLVFTTQPGNATAGSVFGQQPVLKAVDQFENTSTVGLPGSAVIALTSGTGTLSGTTTVNFAGNGTVTYTNLQISTAGVKQLTVSASGLTAAVSNTFTVLPGQAITDNFRSRISGNWATASTWERSPAGDGVNWTTATTAPDAGSANTITVRNGHIVTISTSRTIDQTIVEPEGEIDLTGGTLTIANGTGTDLDVSGSFENTNATAIVTTGTIVFQSGSEYHDQVSSSSTIPTATWDQNSTCFIDTWSGSFPISTKNNLAGQNFGNFTIDHTSTGSGAGSLLSSSGGTITVNGNFTLNATSGRDIALISSGSTAGTLTVKGDFNIIGSGSTFILNNGSTGAVNLFVTGNFSNAGTFTPGTSTVTFNGNSPSIIGGSSSTSFNNLTINKVAAATTVTSVTKAFTVTGNLAVAQGNLILQATDANYAVTGNLTVSANGTLTHSVDWDIAGKLLSVGGNVAIDGSYGIGSASRAHLQMLNGGKTIHTGSSALNIVTMANSTGTITADGPVTANNNFWTPSGGTFSTNGQTIIAKAALLVSGGGTLNVTGAGTIVNVTGGLFVGANKTGGAVNISAGTITTDGITLGDATGSTAANTITQTGGSLQVNGTVAINQPGANSITNTWNIGAQTPTVTGLISFAGTNTTTSRIGKIIITSGTLNANGGISITGSTPATKVIDMSGGSGTLNVGGTGIAGAGGATFLAGTGTSVVNYNAGGDQLNVGGYSYRNLVFSGSGTKTFLSTSAIASNFSISSNVVANPGSIVTHTAGTLTLGGAGTAAGKWGSTNAPTADHKNNTFFTPTSTGIVTVSNGTCATYAASINVTGTNPICKGSNSTIAVTITGGVSPYTIVYTGGTGGTVNNYVSGSNISVSPISNTSYTLTSVTDANGCTATIPPGTAVAITVNQPPSITKQPINQTITYGQPADFSVEATGIPAATYQWEVDLGDGSGFSTLDYETSATLHAEQPSVAPNGYYLLHVIITNECSSVTSNNVKLTVNPKAAAILANNKSKTYGDDNPDLDAMVTGTVIGEELDYTLSTTAVKYSDVDSYPITVTLGENPNYSITPTDATLTVNKADQIITWNNPANVTYGTVLSEAQLNATVAGVSGGSNPGALTYSPLPGTLLNAGSGQTLHVDAAATQNYTAASKDVTINVNKANPIVTATGGSFTYTGSAHEGSATVKGVMNEDLAPSATLNYTGTPNGGGSYNSSTAPTNAGSYTVTASFAGNDNYNSGSDDDALTIGKANPIVTATGGSFTYTGSAHEGSATVKGVMNEDLAPSATLNYTGTPNGGGSYNSSTAPTNAGSYTVTASFAGNDNYNSGSDDDALTIGQRSATIIANSKSKTYGDDNPTLDAVVNGTVNNDVLNYTLSTTAMKYSGVGDYPITVTLGSNPNYSITPTGATLTVGQRSATIIANGKSKTYGDDNPTLDAVVNGTVNNDVLNYTLSTTAMKYSGVGDYPISVSLGSNPNYNVTPTNGNLHINQRNIIITADPQFKCFGKADPVLTAHVTGPIVNNDMPTGSLSRAPGESGGTYAIYKNTYTYGSNYAETYNMGYLTINPEISAPITTDNPVLYFGYALDQTAKITVKPSGGTGPYKVSITMNRPLNCNLVNSTGDEVWTPGANTNNSSNITCPASGSALANPVSTSANTITSTTGYTLSVTLNADADFTATVTDAAGCSVTSSPFHIHAEDVRCFAGNSGNAKVQLCHKTGSDKNPCVSICVDASAVEEHLAHGDTYGACPKTGPCPPPSRVVSSGSTSSSSASVLSDKLEIKIMPNPSVSRTPFVLSVKGKAGQEIEIRVLNMLGRQVYGTKGTVNQTYKFGSEFISGVYFVQVIQGQKVETIKIIKI